MEVFEYDPYETLNNLKNMLHSGATQSMDFGEITRVINDHDIWSWCSVKEQVQLLVLVALGKSRFFDLVRLPLFTNIREINFILISG